MEKMKTYSNAEQFYTLHSFSPAFALGEKPRQEERSNMQHVHLGVSVHTADLQRWASTSPTSEIFNLERSFNRNQGEILIRLWRGSRVRSLVWIMVIFFFLNRNQGEILMWSLKAIRVRSISTGFVVRTSAEEIGWQGSSSPEPGWDLWQIFKGTRVTSSTGTTVKAFPGPLVRHSTVTRM